MVTIEEDLAAKVHCRDCRTSNEVKNQIKEILNPKYCRKVIELDA